MHACAAISLLRQLFQGPGARIDPLQRLTEVCTPDSLDHVCSIYEAYRSMVFHVMKEDSRRDILHVTGFTDTILFTGNMLRESLAAQKRWHEAFSEEKQRIAARREAMSKAQVFPCYLPCCGPMRVLTTPDCSG